MPASSPGPEHVAVVLIGHGAPATDCPPQLIGELMGLEWRPDHAAPRQRLEELDAKIRTWPRRPDNDPYKAGLERLADAMRPLVPAGLFAVGYNEFCSPSVSEAVEQVIRQGAERVLVIPSMLTPGGVHAERDIPRELEAVRRRHPRIRVDYLWPFDLARVAELFAAHIAAAL